MSDGKSEKRKSANVRDQYVSRLCVLRTGERKVTAVWDLTTGDFSLIEEGAVYRLPVNGGRLLAMKYQRQC